MKIHIHRGQNQIGGSIIEINTDSTRIFLDVGMELDEDEQIDIPKIEGLFCGKKDSEKRRGGVYLLSWDARHFCVGRRTAGAGSDSGL